MSCAVTLDVPTHKLLSHEADYGLSSLDTANLPKGSPWGLRLAAIACSVAVIFVIHSDRTGSQQGSSLYLPTGAQRTVAGLTPNTAMGRVATSFSGPKQALQRTRVSQLRSDTSAPTLPTEVDQTDAHEDTTAHHSGVIHTEELSHEGTVVGSSSSAAAAAVQQPVATAEKEAAWKWRLMKPIVYFFGATLAALLFIRRYTLAPLLAAGRSLLGMNKTIPRFRATGAHVAGELELGIGVAGMEGKTDRVGVPLPVDKNADIKEITAPVLLDLIQLRENLTALIGASNPMLLKVAKQIFGAGGKRLRPVIVFLVAKATAKASGLNELKPQHQRLAEVIEMIHTASLLHDDVLDNSESRRGAETAQKSFGIGVAVLAGDYMFAQSSWYLACLENLTVIKLISRVIADFADGEVAQAGKLFDPSITMDTYMTKSFNKTATLIAASCKSAAVFSEVTPEMCDDMYNYGKHMGLAFQIVDDILDFTQDSETLGKPSGSDLASGNITAPTLYAMEQNPELKEMIASKFAEEGSLDKAISIVVNGGGIAEAEVLAKYHGDLAKACLQDLPDSSYKKSLMGMVDYILSRIN